MRPSEIKRTTAETLGYVIAAFGFVAALAWNEAVKALINKYVKADGTLVSLFIYALVVTLIAVLATARLNAIKEKIVKEEEKKK